ncbi:hypothetical protein H6771_02115 [Candidatus Peribacteria bacterium]|nr:hypothetical protein [Candidatus Peribacteria bacterium]
MLFPRRVRPHVNPLSQLQTHTFTGFPEPWPIIVDIGCMKGEFLDGLRAQLPGHAFIAFEVREPIVQWLQDHWADDPRVAVFGGDACRNFRAILEPCLAKGATLEEVYINFPDPWLKPRHHKRRVLSRAFLQSLMPWVPASTTFLLQTDQPRYYEDTLALLEELGGWEWERFSQSPHGVMTKWEQAKQGQPIYRLRFRYASAAAA